MLLIDLFPSTVTTCREEPQRVPGATTAWFYLRLEKGGRWHGNTSHFGFGPQKRLFALLGLIFGPDKNLRSPTGVSNLYKTLVQSHTNLLIELTLPSSVWAFGLKREPDGLRGRPPDRQIFSNGLGCLSANSQLYGFIWGERSLTCSNFTAVKWYCGTHTMSLSVELSFKACKRHCCFIKGHTSSQTVQIRTFRHITGV